MASTITIPDRFNHLSVQPYDHPLRFKVQSKARHDIVHVVDLGAFNGNGECSCEHFQFRLLPKLQEQPGKKTWRCKHIEAARSALVDEVIKKLK